MCTCSAPCFECKMPKSDVLSPWSASRYSLISSKSIIVPKSMHNRVHYFQTCVIPSDHLFLGYAALEHCQRSQTDQRNATGGSLPLVRYQCRPLYRWLCCSDGTVRYGCLVTYKSMENGSNCLFRLQDRHPWCCY
jgi:hypothetical protein